MALIGHLQVAKKIGAASATPDGRFERLTYLKPPALPGDTYSTSNARSLLATPNGKLRFLLRLPQ